MGDIKDCVNMAQFNKLRQSMEEKQDRLTRDLQALLTKIRGRRQPHDGASHMVKMEKIVMEELLLEEQENK